MNRDIWSIRLFASILLTFGFLINRGHGEQPEKSTPTSVPVRVCASVDRLNVRSGPGINFNVVGGLIYGQCETSLAISDDGKWYKVAQGWVSSQYVVVQGNISTPGPTQSNAVLPGAAALQPSLLPDLRLTATPDTSLQDEAGKIWAPVNSFFKNKEYLDLLNLDEFKNWLFANPLRALLILLCVYFGLISAQRFSFGRLILNSVLILVAISLIYLLWQNGFRAFPAYLFPYDFNAMVNLFTTSFGCYVGGLVLGLIIYRPSGSVEHGAHTRCVVCGQVQRQDRMRVCPGCNQPFCDFPAWNRSSIRSMVDGVATWIAVPLGIFLTAFSILGGILVLSVLAVPYVLFRVLLPENNRPLYWKNCGIGSYCSRCYAKKSPAVSSSGDSSSSSSRDSGYDRYGNDPYEREPDDTGTNSSHGSMIAGWLFDFGKSDNDDDDDDDDDDD